MAKQPSKKVVVVPAPKGSELNLESKTMIKAKADKIHMQKDLGADPVATRVKLAGALGKHKEANLYKKGFSPQAPGALDRAQETIMDEIYDGKRPPPFKGDSLLLRPKKTWEQTRQKLADMEAQFAKENGPLR